MEYVGIYVCQDGLDMPKNINYDIDLMYGGMINVSIIVVIIAVLVVVVIVVVV